jgi:hypothetical protein
LIHEDTRTDQIRRLRDVELADLGQRAVRVDHVFRRPVGERAEECVLRDRGLVIEVAECKREELREAVDSRVRVPTEPKFYEARRLSLGEVWACLTYQ